MPVFPCVYEDRFCTYDVFLSVVSFSNLFCFLFIVFILIRRALDVRVMIAGSSVSDSCYSNIDVHTSLLKCLNCLNLCMRWWHNEIIARVIFSLCFWICLPMLIFMDG